MRGCYELIVIGIFKGWRRAALKFILMLGAPIVLRRAPASVFSSKSEIPFHLGQSCEVASSNLKRPHTKFGAFPFIKWNWKKSGGEKNIVLHPLSTSQSALARLIHFIAILGWFWAGLQSLPGWSHWHPKAGHFISSSACDVQDKTFLVGYHLTWP